MADLHKVGSRTPQAVIYKSESHKLHQAFPVKKGDTMDNGVALDHYRNLYSRCRGWICWVLTVTDSDTDVDFSLCSGIRRNGTVVIQFYWLALNDSITALYRECLMKLMRFTFVNHSLRGS